MFAEVYSGTRPGRPGVLHALSAAVLAGTLGVAWVQVHAARTLGAEQRIGTTSLHVRPPRGWHVDPKSPNRFVLPVKEKGRRAAFEFERRLQFDLVRLPGFQSLEQLVRRPEFSGAGEAVGATRAKIGRYEAVELERREPFRIGRERFARETVTRLTCLPRGHVIRVYYEPLGKFLPTDREILDEVCETLWIEDPTLTGTPGEHLRRAGLQLSPQPAWQIVGTDFAEAPGVYIGGSSDGLPAWSIAIYRTWLAFGRTPRDLLVDYAGEHWLVRDVADRVSEQSRADGATVATLQHPEFGTANVPVSSVWVVAQAPERTALLFVSAGPAEVAAADAIAGRLAAQMECEALDSLPAMSAVEQAGARLVQDLQKNGPAPRWGRQAIETTYRHSGRDEVVIVKRAAVEHEPARGYEGSLWRRLGPAGEDHVAWQLDGRAVCYAWQTDFFQGRSQVRVVEKRSQPDGPATRRIFRDDQLEVRFSFTPGATFVAPPAESIIKGWVARQEVPAAIVTVSSPLGPATHTVLLRHLPPDGNWPRVFVQQDFWPAGAVEAYDDARAETEYEQYPSGVYRRAS